MKRFGSELTWSHYTTPPLRSVLWRSAVILVAALTLAIIPGYLIELPQPPGLYIVQCSPGFGFTEHYARAYEDEDEADADAAVRIRSHEYAACSILPTLLLPGE